MGSLPIDGKSFHRVQVFLQVGSLPIDGKVFSHMGSLPIYCEGFLVMGSLAINGNPPNRICHAWAQMPLRVATPMLCGLAASGQP
jgi:hypothetical protein